MSKKQKSKTEGIRHASDGVSIR